MTDREKEIRDAEKKAMAEVRRWRRKESKKLAVMTDEEFVEYHEKEAEKLRARGYDVVYSLN